MAEKDPPTQHSSQKKKRHIFMFIINREGTSRCDRKKKKELLYPYRDIVVGQRGGDNYWSTRVESADTTQCH